MSWQTFLDHKKSDTVFIIGGGPSRLRLLPDPKVLANKDVILCNNAYQLLDNKIYVCMDQAWHHRHKLELAKRSGPKAICTVFPHEFSNKGLDHVFKQEKLGPLSTNENFLYVTNTGAMALNVAFLMGYKTMVLIGFDCDKGVEQQHWHPDEFYCNPELYAVNFIPNFEKIAADQEKYGIRIINTNLESMVRCFEFGNLNDFL